MRSNSSKTTAKANARKAVKAKTTKTKESKSDIVERMLLASNGTTRELLSKATKWDYVNLTVAAKRAGKKLWKRDGRVGLE